MLYSRFSEIDLAHSNYVKATQCLRSQDVDANCPRAQMDEHSTGATVTTPGREAP